MAKILLVDDSNFSRRILRKMIEPVGHEVREATDGMQALEQYVLERPDVVLLDMNMVGMTGIDVLSKLRQLDPNANVVIATADIQQTTRTMTQAEGARGFIAKPFVVEQVLSVINASLIGG